MFVAAAEAGLLVGEEQATTSAGRREVTSVRRGPYRASMRYILSFASLHTLIPSRLPQPVAAPRKTKGECEMKTLGLVVEVKCGQYEEGAYGDGYTLRTGNGVCPPSLARSHVRFAPAHPTATATVPRSVQPSSRRDSTTRRLSTTASMRWDQGNGKERTGTPACTYVP
ncbi:hypothetical protein B0H14DRAFT_3125068 [Mycena olivaceomarginata]|nr:hypothetical protein B0H14DRAFT_3125068 [Mycena olivaceomarginata]